LLPLLLLVLLLPLQGADWLICVAASAEPAWQVHAWQVGNLLLVPYDGVLVRSA
jgi:hypothetical protein